MKKFDVIVIGAGVAGLSAAYELSKTKKVLVLEQEEQAGYHSTGRSAAVYASAYGSENTALYSLVRTSWDFFKSPPQGFTKYPLYTERGILFIADKANIDGLNEYFAEMADRNPDAKLVDKDFINQKLPRFQENFTQSAIYDPNVYDIDVSALQEGYLQAIRSEGGTIQTNWRASIIHQKGDTWVISNGQDNFEAPILVNAAGAWVDKIAQMASVKEIDIQPLRRSAILIDGPDGPDVDVPPNWPMVVEYNEEFFFKPDAGKLMVSPANEDLSEPCDAQAEELDIAYAAHYAETALELSVKKVNHSWAGLRNFVEDRSPVVGFAPDAKGFFWLAGQGGFGIQTAPAVGRLVAALVSDQDIPEDMKAYGLTNDLVSPIRLFSK